jgi:hypothetical protein
LEAATSRQQQQDSILKCLQGVRPILSRAYGVAKLLLFQLDLFIAYRTGLQKTISPSNQTRFTFHHFSFSSSQVFKRRKSGQGNGTVGKLTRGLISRTDYYAHTVTLALIPFMNPTLYQAHCTGMAWTPPSS